MKVARLVIAVGVVLSAMLPFAAAAEGPVFVPSVARFRAAATLRELVRNGGFADGLTGWVAYSEAGHDLARLLVPDATMAAVLGDGSVDALSQAVTIPSATRAAQVTFRLRRLASDQEQAGVMVAYVFPAEGFSGYRLLATADATSVGTTWTTYGPFDVTDYAGMALTLQFSTFAGCDATFAIDDVSLAVQR